MEIISNIALISINETLIVQVISFLIFLFLINRIMFRPLRRAMNERENHIRKMQREIVDAEKEFELLTNQVRKNESAVIKEAHKISEKLEESGSQQAAEISNTTRQEIDALKKKTKKEIDAQIIEARKEIKTASETLALNIMEKVLDRRLSP